jgi:hypothetical protein
MTVEIRSLADTTHRAILVLEKELGIVETVRFLTQFGTGFGDYTRERDAIFRDLTMDEILSEIGRTHRGRPKRIRPTHKKRARG